MPFTDQRLYRARGLEPVAGYNEIVMLADQAGPIQKYKSPFFQVGGIEPIQGLGPHGAIVIYSQAAAAPAGYEFPTGAASGTIVAAGSTQAINMARFQQGPKQLLQARFSIEFLALTGAVVHDIDVQLYQPSAVGRFGTLNQSPGFLNAADQFQAPADQIVDPAQGALRALPAAFPALHPADVANLREFFVWEINGPTWKIINNGAASLTAGTVLIRLWGFRYDLIPLTPDYPQPWAQTLVFGTVRKTPVDPRGAPLPFTTIPLAPFAGTGQYSG
jgi:hypothetical protein